jgi:integrase
MPLTLRRRGKTYHARGTIRVGKESVTVPEFSTGATSRAAAETIAEAKTEELRRELLDGPEERARRVTIADCLDAYISRPGGVEPYDLARVAEFNTMIGDRALADIQDAWAEWLRRHGSHFSPGSAARWRSILQSALNVGTKRHTLPAIHLPRIHQVIEERVAYLSIDEQDRLLASYNDHARPVVTVLCFAGLRTQEALRQDWRNIDWKRATMFVPKSKNGRARTLPMHIRIIAELQPIWELRGRPEGGTVFLSARGQPYSDTHGKGGNPLAKAHATACRRAGITDFRIHDWRHHWASRMVMSGCDLFTLMKLGGWKSPQMVQRYASVSTEHLSNAIAKLV